MKIRSYGDANNKIVLFQGGEWRYSSTHSSGLSGVQWPASHNGHITSGEIAHNTHWIEGWVRPKASLDDKNMLPLQAIKLQFLHHPHPAHSLVTNNT